MGYAMAENQENQDQCPVPARSYIPNGTGRKEYSILAKLNFIVEGGTLRVEMQPLTDSSLAELEGAEGKLTILDPMPSPPLALPGWLPMGEAAKRLGMSYSWLAHHWRDMGLHPTKYAQRRLFEVAELDTFMRRRRVTYRGRPPKKRGPDA